MQTGLEVQVETSIGTGKHDFGAIYDLVGPKKVPHLSPDWNTITVTCKGPHISAAVNGETIAEINCDEWTTPGHCPDGSKNKFKMAIKDFPRRGYIGFQDHDHKVWFKNVKIRELADKLAEPRAHARRRSAVPDRGTPTLPSSGDFGGFEGWPPGCGRADSDAWFFFARDFYPYELGPELNISEPVLADDLRCRVVRRFDRKDFSPGYKSAVGWRATGLPRSPDRIRPGRRYHGRP